ncbi:hypothetical protein F5Y16DRAFT_345005 [Xylariaceae sp. FL0255]|nr:hypothetical protein F5Y16DRAFT_345005 [Xylariaceae sp. FL0255]
MDGVSRNCLGSFAIIVTTLLAASATTSFYIPYSTIFADRNSRQCSATSSTNDKNPKKSSHGNFSSRLSSILATKMNGTKAVFIFIHQLNKGLLRRCNRETFDGSFDLV